MATNLLNKYVWLVETIYKAKRINYGELNKKWLECELSDGVDLPARTFHKWRVGVEELFGLNIECEHRGSYRYYIADTGEFKDGNIRRWLLNTISISNLLAGNRQLKDRIVLENVPSGQEYLSDIIEAMKKSHCINMTYQSYWKEKSHTFDVEPYCVKLFKQRWYLVAHNPHYGKIMIYGLDRIHQLKILPDARFKVPDTFRPDEYFDEYFGVIVDGEARMACVRLKASAGQANYLRSLPLHHSQQEVERTDSYSIFELNVRITYDFLQEILHNGENVEVLEPLWFREEIAGVAHRMSDKYNKQDRQI